MRTRRSFAIVAAMMLVVASGSMHGQPRPQPPVPEDNRPRLALLPFTAHDLNPAAAEFVHHVLRQDEAVNAVFSLVSAEATAAAITQLKAASVEVGSASGTVVAFSKLVNAPWLLSGRVQRINDAFHLLTVTLTYCHTLDPAPAVQTIGTQMVEFKELIHIREACRKAGDTVAQQWRNNPNPPHGLPAHLVWNPAATLAVVIGLAGTKPPAGRQDVAIVEALRNRGVLPDRLVYWPDQQATSATVLTNLAPVLRRAGESDVLVFCYFGLGNTDAQSKLTYFYLADSDDRNFPRTGLGVKTLFDWIEQNFRGTRALIAVDSGECFAAVAEAEAREKAGSRVSYAVVASRMVGQTGATSWTFAKAVADGFRSHARLDANSDGRLTLREWLDEIDRDMAFFELRLTARTCARAFDGAWLLGRTVPLDGDLRLQARCQVWTQNQWLRAQIVEVLDAKRQARVHFIGLDSKFDAVVDWARIKPWDPDDFEGDVHGQWTDGKWYPAKILVGRLGVYKVRWADATEVWLSQTQVRRAQ